MLAKLIAGGMSKTFDFVYIDGSHTTPDVLADLVLCFELCRHEGLIICDDYLWTDNHPNPLTRPKMGIDSFLNCYGDKIRIWNKLPLHQLYFQKTEE
jgi:predicted O-methyltransferase YrrM